MTDERKRLHYDIAVMARLRYPAALPQDSDEEAAEEGPNDARDEYARDLERAYDEAVEIADLTAGEEYGPAYPDVLADEIATVSDQLHRLEQYRDRLIVFARALASKSVPARTLAACTGLSHSTIVRMADDNAIGTIADQVSPVAQTYLHGLNLRDDPKFYARLQYAANAAAAYADDPAPSTPAAEPGDAAAAVPQHGLTKGRSQ